MKEPVIHLERYGGCGGIAFYLVEPVKAGDAILARHFMKLDGSYPVYGDPIVCGSCNNRKNELYETMKSCVKISEQYLEKIKEDSNE